MRVSGRPRHGRCCGRWSKGSLDVGDYRNAAVLRAPKRGGPTEEVVGAGKVKRVTGLIVDNRCVYWSEGEVQRAGPGKPPVPGKIGCVSKDGQRTFPVPPARNPTVLLADQSHLYWLSNVGGRTSLFMAQKRTTRATPIRKARPDIVTLDHDSTHFYWIRRTGALERLAKSGGRVETLGNAPGRALAVGPTGPLVASGEQTCSIPFVRGAPTCLKLSTTALMSIGTDENHVYWFELSRVTRMPISAFAARRSNASALRRSGECRFRSNHPDPAFFTEVRVLLERGKVIQARMVETMPKAMGRWEADPVGQEVLADGGWVRLPLRDQMPGESDALPSRVRIVGRTMYFRSHSGAKPLVLRCNWR